jgi:imidazole glycerol-phosphate synthase subunit HisF
MLYPRIIPVLLVKDKGLVKTIQFSTPKYVGDPINAVRIFNEKEVDELTVLDIDATAENRVPDMMMIRNLAAECRMPLCYGGGINSADQIQEIVALGVEKVAISAAAVENPQLIAEAAQKVGNQSVVVVMDVKRSGFKDLYEVCTQNGRKRTGKNPIEFAQEMEKLGAGEIVINSIDNDGVMKGYDLGLMRGIREAVSVPVTALGGAGSLQDIGEVIQECGVSGAAAGSLFVFKGIYKAVLINYPKKDEKEALWKKIDGRLSI